MYKFNLKKRKSEKLPLMNVDGTIYYFLKGLMNFKKLSDLLDDYSNETDITVDNMIGQFDKTKKTLLEITDIPEEIIDYFELDERLTFIYDCVGLSSDEKYLSKKLKNQKAIKSKKVKV